MSADTPLDYCTFFETLADRRRLAGGSGVRWADSSLPCNLQGRIAQLDRTMYGMQGIARVLAAGFAARSADDDAEHLLGDNVTSSLHWALGELAEHACHTIEAIAHIYPERSERKHAS